jgi:hypothetical protein
MSDGIHIIELRNAIASGRAKPREKAMTSLTEQQARAVIAP